MMNKKSHSEKTTAFVTHLKELRMRLLIIVTTITLIFLSLLYFANDLYTFLALPLLNQLTQTHTLIATNVASPFLAPLKLTLVLSFFIAIPVVLYHLWAFIAPGLYKSEKRFALPLLVSSWLLFYLGIVFCYFVVFPLVFHFFQAVAPASVTMMPDISQFLSFTLKMFFAFGAAFEVPVVVVLLIQTGIMTHQQLAEKRRYIIIFAFVFGMLLTPPDVISQVLLAIPIWLLFEIGLLFSAILSKYIKS